jgi:hypothetical protein
MPIALQAGCMYARYIVLDWDLCAGEREEIRDKKREGLNGIGESKGNRNASQKKEEIDTDVR